MPARVVIDWAVVASREDFFACALPQCGSPPWHGRNLDALADAWVTGDIDAGGPPYEFEFVHGDRVPTALRGFAAAVHEIARESVAAHGGSCRLT